MLTYFQAMALLEKAKNKGKGKPIARNTRLFDRGDHVAVRFHNTDIVRVYPNDIYQMNTGGWYTATTKERISRYIPLSIFSHKREWFLTGYIRFDEIDYIDHQGHPCDRYGNLVSLPRFVPKARGKQQCLF